MKVQDVISLGSSYLESLVFSGVTFGWPSLQLVLEQEGYFQDQCENPINSTMNTTVSTLQLSCAKKEASFNLVFTLATTLMFLLVLPFGYTLDFFGTWIFRCILTSMFTLGNVLLTVSSASTSYLVYPAIILPGVAGLGFHIGNLPLVNLASHGRGTLTTLMDGMFDSSPLVFFLIKKSYESGINLNAIFTFLMCLSILPWLKTFIFMPSKSIPDPVPSNFRYGWKEWSCFKSRNDTEAKGTSNIDATAESSVMIEDTRRDKEKTFKECLRSKLFWTNVFHFVIITFRVNFFLGSLITWLKAFRNENEIRHLADVLGIVFLFSAFAAPLNGLLVDVVIKVCKRKISNKQVLNLRGIFFSMLTTSLLSILLSSMVVIPNVYAAFLFIFVTKTFVYGGFSTFLIFQYPIQHFGKLYGLTSLISGVVGLLQFPLFNLAVAVDPTFKSIHIGLLVFTILTVMHPIAVYLEAKKSSKSAK